MSNVKTYYASSQGNINITPNFKVKEFKCKDGTNGILIDYELVCLLQYIRDIVKKPLIINSGYRTASYNKKVGGAKNSYHIKGRAFDVSGADVSYLCNIAYSIGIKGIIKYNTFVHIDSRDNTYHANSNGKLLKYSKVNIPYMGELLKYGMNNYKVGVLQYRLNYLGFNAGKVDGIFGNNTLQALKAFQKAEGISIDGIYGKITHSRLF